MRVDGGLHNNNKTNFSLLDSHHDAGDQIPQGRDRFQNFHVAHFVGTATSETRRKQNMRNAASNCAPALRTNRQ